VKLSFLGAAHEVTGSRTLVEVGNYRLLVDYGMEQGLDLYANPTLPLSAKDIDCVLLTHAHIDHSGLIPSLVAQGFSGPIYATEATEKLCRIMLLDSAHIQESEANWKNRKAKRKGEKPYVPLYTVADAQQSLSQFHGCRYDIDYDILDGIRVRFTDAGHLLGSASITIEYHKDEKTESILFSGDLGNVDRPLIRNPQIPDGADYVVIESTYGDRMHGERPDYVSQLTRILQETLDRGGNLIIPAFSVGRTQEFLYLLREIKQSGAIKGHPNFPVYVDSPLSVEATKIYSDGLTDFYDAETLKLLQAGIDPIQFTDLRTSVSSQDSIALNTDPVPKVILSASGMCEAGRIRHHLKHNLWKPESTILFVGYQSVNTMGRRLLDGARTVKLFGEEIQVRAKIEQMAGISGHADQRIMLDWLTRMPKKPKKVFVNHGDDEVTDQFANLIRSQLSLDAVAPYNGSVYDLEKRVWLQEGSRERIEKKPSSKAKKNNPLYDELVAAGKRLLKLIEQSIGLSSNGIKEFKEDIEKLLAKWNF